MMKIKKCCLLFFLFLSMPLSLKAIETDEVKKINFSEIYGEDGNEVNYNADESRIETTHSAGDKLLKTELIISSYDGVVPYHIFSFDLGNQGEDMELSVKITGNNEYSLEENQAILLEGEPFSVSYVSQGTFVVPKAFSGRIYIPIYLENEHIQTVDLLSRNKSSDVSFYTSSFRVMNLSEDEFITALLNSKMSITDKQISSSLKDQYDIEYVAEAGFIDSQGNITTSLTSGMKQVKMNIQGKDNFQMLYAVDLSKIETVVTEKPIEVIKPVVIEPTVIEKEKIVDGFISNSDLTTKVLPINESIVMVTGKHSFIMSGFFPFFLVILYISALGAAIYGIIYLVKDFIGK